MAAIYQLKNGIWRAQLHFKGHRDSATFATKSEAEIWAKNMDATIRGSAEGERMQLTPREWVDLCNRAKERARMRGIEYKLTRQDMEYLFEVSQGRCSVSGIVFNRFRPLNSTKRPWYPSLDRIDSSKPYTLDNCRFVCVAVNIAMGEWGEWVIKGIAKAIVKGEQVICDGPQEDRYEFPALVGAPENYRQIVRRRMREKRKKFTPNSRQNEDGTIMEQGLTT